MNKNTSIGFFGRMLRYMPLLVLSIVVHELGHFAVAKLYNVGGIRFSIFFGPPIAKMDIGETEFALAVVPLGGYNSISFSNSLSGFSSNELAGIKAHNPAR